MIDHFKTTLGLKEADKKVFKRKPMHFRSKILLQETKVSNKKIKTLCETIYNCCEQCMSSLCKFVCCVRVGTVIHIL